MTPQRRRQAWVLGAGLACPLAAHAEEPLSTDRPDFVEFSDVMGPGPGPGRWQVETGLPSERARADGLKSRTTTTPLLLRLGGGHALELRLETDGAIRSTTTDTASDATRRERGFADLSLGLKWRMQEGDEAQGTPLPSWPARTWAPGRTATRCGSSTPGSRRRRRTSPGAWACRCGSDRRARTPPAHPIWMRSGSLVLLSSGLVPKASWKPWCWTAAPLARNPAGECVSVASNCSTRSLAAGPLALRLGRPGFGLAQQQGSPATRIRIADCRYSRARTTMHLTSLFNCLPRRHGHNPAETGNAAPGTAHEPTQPGGRLAALRTRRSSGPMAPQLKAPRILDLSNETLTKIFTPRLGDPGRDLPAIHDTCKAFQKVVVEDDGLKFRRVMGRIARAADESVDRGPIFDSHDLQRQIALLPLLGAAQRTHLVDRALGPKAYGMAYSDNDGGIRERAAAIGYVARGMAHLDKDQQTKLVNQAIGFADGNHFNYALKGFSTELAHLDKALYKQLIDKAISIGDGPQRQRDLAIAYLCKGLKYLDAHDQRILFEKATQLPLEFEKATAIQNLAGSLESLGRDQRDTLVTSARNLYDQGEDNFKLKAICGLATGLVHLEPQQIKKLVTEFTTPPCVSSDGAEVIAALGTNLRHLTEAQQDKLFNATTQIMDPRDKAIAIAGLAAGFASVDTSVRKDQLGDRLVDMALSLSLSRDVAHAIAALGPRLGHLKQDRHEELVDAAIRVFKCSDTTGRGQIRALSAGLGAGFASLRPDLRSKLIDTVTRVPSSNALNQHASAAEAIAGLGAGLPHLDEAQVKALLAAAAELDSSLGWKNLKRIALQGFAAEAAKVAIKE